MRFNHWQVLTFKDVEKTKQLKGGLFYAENNLQILRNHVENNVKTSIGELVEVIETELHPFIMRMNATKRKKEVGFIYPVEN